MVISPWLLFIRETAVVISCPAPCELVGAYAGTWVTLGCSYQVKVDMGTILFAYVTSSATRLN